MKTTLCLMLLAMPLMGADLTLDKSKGKVIGETILFEEKPFPFVFKNYEITAREPDGVKIHHASGITKIPYELLPSELTKDAPFDPVAAKTYRDAQNAARAKVDAAIAKQAEQSAKKVVAAAQAKKAEVSAKGSEAYEQERQEAAAKMRRLEAFVAGEINRRTGRISVNPVGYKGKTDKVAYVQQGGSWWPGNPIMDPDARYSFDAKDAVEQWHALKRDYGL